MPRCEVLVDRPRRLPRAPHVFERVQAEHEVGAEVPRVRALHVEHEVDARALARVHAHVVDVAVELLDDGPGRGLALDLVAAPLQHADLARGEVRPKSPEGRAHEGQHVVAHGYTRIPWSFGSSGFAARKAFT